MTDTIKIDIVSAEKSIFSGIASMVFVTGSMGEIGVAPGHAPLLTALRPGQVRVQLPEKDELVFYISGGLLEVQPKVVTVLADTAIRAEDLDEAAAIEAREAAERKFKEQGADFNYSQALAELALTAARIRAIKSLRQK